MGSDYANASGHAQCEQNISKAWTVVDKAECSCCWRKHSVFSAEKFGAGFCLPSPHALHPKNLFSLCPNFSSPFNWIWVKWTPVVNGGVKVACKQWAKFIFGVTALTSTVHRMEKYRIMSVCTIYGTMPFFWKKYFSKCSSLKCATERRKNIKALY